MDARNGIFLFFYCLLLPPPPPPSPHLGSWLWFRMSERTDPITWFLISGYVHGNERVHLCTEEYGRSSCLMNCFEKKRLLPDTAAEEEPFVCIAYGHDVAS